MEGKITAMSEYLAVQIREREVTGAHLKAARTKLREVLRVCPFIDAKADRVLEQTDIALSGLTEAIWKLKRERKARTGRLDSLRRWSEDMRDTGRSDRGRIPALRDR